MNSKPGDNYRQALGIYKFENKDSYLETHVTESAIEFNCREGIGNRKPDKACLIVFSNQPYTIYLIDNQGKETDYW